MKWIPMWSVLALLALSAPAHAGVVAEAGFGTTFANLVVGRDGDVWTFANRLGRDAVGHAGRDGRFRLRTTSATSDVGALGPDGTAWYRLTGGSFLRSDSRAALDTLRTRGGSPGDEFATGPDGTLWAPTREQDGFWHVTRSGKVTRVSADLPEPCEAHAIVGPLVRASDDAMWLAEFDCKQLVRIGPKGDTRVFKLRIEPYDMVADASGGVWVIDLDGKRLFEVDPAGTVTRVPFSQPYPDVFDLAAAPDGSVWLAFNACRALRISPTGRSSWRSLPVPAFELAFTPAGGVWMTSGGRLAHLSPGERAGPCDDRAPAFTLAPDDDRMLPIARLKADGVTVTVREPAIVDLWPSYFDDDHLATEGRVRARSFPHGGTLRYRVPPALLRSFRRTLDNGHQRPQLHILVFVRGANGNIHEQSLDLQIDH